MASVRRRAGSVRVTLDRGEVALLAGLVTQVDHLLTADDDGLATTGDPLELMVGMPGADAVPAPDDPALRRLLPDAYRDDPAAAQEFRRLTDGDVRAAKRTALQQVVHDLTAGAVTTGRSAGGAAVALADEQADAWLHALTDVRLALGTRLDVGEDIDEERRRLSPDSQRYAEIAVYDWLSWLQDSLVRAVSRGLG